MNASKSLLRQPVLVSIGLLAVVLLVLFPALLDTFRLNLVGKYLSYAFVAIGLVVLWGWGGVLSLGQGVFFGLGGYAMGMFLKLEALDPETTKIQSTPGIPDFMDWNQVTALPFWWEPFHSLTFYAGRGDRSTDDSGVSGELRHVQTARGRRLLRHHHPGRGPDHDDPDCGAAGVYRRINGMTDLRTMLSWDTRTDSPS